MTGATQKNLDKRYHVVLISFQNNNATIKHAEYSIYTDGSKTENGVGSGFVVYHKNERIQMESFSLPTTTTVFQAEVAAIYEAMLYMINHMLLSKNTVRLTSGNSGIKLKGS